MSSIIKPLGNLPVTSLLAAVLLAASAAPGRAQPAPGAASAGANGPALPTDLQPILAREVPATATACYLLQGYPLTPPLPVSFYAQRTGVSWFVSASTGLFFVEDPSMTAWFQALASAGALAAGQADASTLPLPPAGGGSSGGTNGPRPARLDPPPGSLWLQALVDTNTAGSVYIDVHGAGNANLFYQLESKAVLNSPFLPAWTLGPVWQGSGTTNDVWFTNSCTAPPANFYRVVSGSVEAYVQPESMPPYGGTPLSSTAMRAEAGAFFSHSRLGSTKRPRQTWPFTTPWRGRQSTARTTRASAATWSFPPTRSARRT